MLGPLIRTISLALVALVIVGGLVFAGSGFMVMLPALGLLVPLLCGRYLGERPIVRIRRSLAAARLLSVGGSAPTGERTGHALLYRGGRLIAASIAVRPPPAVS